MSRRPSDKTKKIRKMGTGEGAYYKPYITTSEFNSLGTTSVIRDWKTGRQVHCLSQGEALWYYVLRWNDNNIDIREQFPMDNELTNKVADSLGIKHPVRSTHIMTTDFLVTQKDKTFHAYSVKPDVKSITKRNLEIMCIEKTYWNAMGCGYDVLLKTDVNMVLANNIRTVTEYYDIDRVFDKCSMIKHLIATKKIVVDLEKEPLTTAALEEYGRKYYGKDLIISW